MKEEILTLIEVEDETGKIASVSMELLSAARKLSTKLVGTLSAVIIGYNLTQHVKEIAKYVDKVYVLDDENAKNFNPDIHLYVLENLCMQMKPSYILIGHTYNGADLAVRLSARLKTPLTTNCIGIELDQKTGWLITKKQVYGGNVIALLACEGKPQILTLRQKVWNEIREQKKKVGDVIRLNIKLDESLSKVKFIKRIKGETVKLDNADCIIAGGRGLGGPEGFKELERLKIILQKFFKKVEIGATRPPVDKGWVSSSRQIGFTGQKVSPIIYFAIGISGATQHLIGMEKSKIVIAINSDPKAYIFSAADIGAVGDYREILSSCIKKLEEEFS